MGKIAFLDKIGVQRNMRTKVDAQDVNEIKASVNALYDIFDTVGSAPVGMQIPWWNIDTIPTGYELITESQQWFSKVDYASLYTALGGEANVFGVTATEFSIPYYPEGTSIVQIGSNFGLGVKGGAKTHLLTKEELPAVNCVGVANQTTVTPGEIGAIKKSKVGDGNVTGNSFDTNGLGSEPNTLNIFPFPNLGSGTPINIMNPYIGGYSIIKVRTTAIVPIDNPTYILSTTTASSNVQIPIPAGTFIKDIDVFVVSGTPTINIPSINSGDMSGQDLYPSTANLRFASDGLLDVNVSGGTVKIQVIKYNI